MCSDRERVCGEIEREGVYVERERNVEIECVQNDRNVFMSRDRESVYVRLKRDIKGPLPVMVRLGLGYQAFCPVFHFLTFCYLALCPLAFCPGLDLVYTAEIRGQPLAPL